MSKSWFDILASGAVAALIMFFVDKYVVKSSESLALRWTGLRRQALHLGSPILTVRLIFSAKSTVLEPLLITKSCLAPHFPNQLALIVITLLLSFRGFPYAFISLTGYFLSMTAINTFLGVWINPGKDHQTYFTKIITSAIGVGLLLAGDWIINQGGLVSLSFGNPSAEEGTTLTFSFIAWITGFLGALKGTHKNESMNEVIPDDDAPTNTKVEYLLKLKLKLQNDNHK